MSCPLLVAVIAQSPNIGGSAVVAIIIALVVVLTIQAIRGMFEP